MNAPNGRIAFLGLGLMGSRQAARLFQAGCRGSVWNRSAEKAAPLAGYGAAVARTPAAAVIDADYVFTMLENGPIVEDVVFRQGVADAMKPGSILVDCSSVKPAEAIRIGSDLAGRGVGYVDAPVSGGPSGAEAGLLAIMAGGSEADFERVEPLLNLMGRPVHVGPCGAGQLAKLANQIIVGISIGAISEALTLAARGGCDIGKVRDALRGGFAESRILELHGERIVTRDFRTRSRSVTQLKDLRNALETAESSGISDLPLTRCVTGMFAALIEASGDVDHSGLVLEVERRNPPSSSGADRRPEAPGDH